MLSVVLGAFGSIGHGLNECSHFYSPLSVHLFGFSSPPHLVIDLSVPFVLVLVYVVSYLGQSFSPSFETRVLPTQAAFRGVWLYVINITKTDLSDVCPATFTTL